MCTCQRKPNTLDQSEVFCRRSCSQICSTVHFLNERLLDCSGKLTMLSFFSLRFVKRFENDTKLPAKITICAGKVISDFKKPRRQWQRKRGLKYKFALLILRDYSNSFNSYNVAELSRNRKVGNGVQVETEKKKSTFMSSRSP